MGTIQKLLNFCDKEPTSGAKVRLAEEQMRRVAGSLVSILALFVFDQFLFSLDTFIFAPDSLHFAVEIVVARIAPLAVAAVIGRGRPFRVTRRGRTTRRGGRATSKPNMKCRKIAGAHFWES